MNAETRLIDMTLADLFAVLDERDRQREASKPDGLPSVVYGLDGICQIYHCTKATAFRIKKSGRIDNAITQIGKKIVVDVRKALALCPKNN